MHKSKPSTEFVLLLSTVTKISIALAFGKGVSCFPVLTTMDSWWLSPFHTLNKCFPYLMYHRPLIGLKYHYKISYLTTETHPMKTRPKTLIILADVVVAEGGVLCIRSHDIGHAGSTGSWRLWTRVGIFVSSQFGEITENASYVYLSPKHSGAKRVCEQVTT